MNNNVNVIEQIHHEFKTSYLETFRISENTASSSDFVAKEEYEKAPEYGFSNSISVKEYFIKKKIHEESTEMLETLKRFKVDYPTKKFITFKDTADIIRKYGLIIAEPSKFIGEFPEKNLKEMASFKLKEQDEAYIFNDLTKLYETNQTKWLREEGDMWNSMRRSLTRSLDISGRSIQQELEDKIPSKEIFSHYINHSHSIISKKDGFADWNETKLNTNKFLIIGTKDQFQLNANEVMIGGSIVELKDDPIVLKPVKNGFLIITCWGDEAQLPEIKDYTQN